ncbi:NfeD family protein [Paenisporosarcina cavernae]|uniref:Uncharacterized protein n=1 Tax=Paenisporosarcina cavernae TaxID=2320858 RepID=A0A385YTH9_9BACL|nr:NfeD family protein [Paenisporosarcina cavernae]AYC29620.1 hypothetical protein D3873_06865 [Paenisporosarcina cavernae]
MDTLLSPTYFEWVTHPVVVVLLLTIASICLTLELFSPGLGIPGVIGFSALLLFYVGHVATGHASWQVIILFLLGLFLLFAELFLPGAIAGIMGIGLIIVSILFAGASLTVMTIAVLIALVAAILGMVIMVKLFGKNVKLFNKIILNDATTTDAGYVSNINRLELIGETAIAITGLRPSGTIMWNNERIDAVSEGNFIEKGRSVKILKVEGSRIVVRELTKKEEEE